MQCGQDADTESQPISSGVFLRNHRPLPTQLLTEAGPHSELGWGAGVGASVAPVRVSSRGLHHPCNLDEESWANRMLQSRGTAPRSLLRLRASGDSTFKGLCAAFAVLWRVACVAVRKRFLRFCLRDRVGVAAKVRDRQS